MIKTNNGFLLVDKTEGNSSFFELNAIKKKFNTKKVGHCGTLDPFATGLLIVGINSYTKLLTLFDNATKTYIGKIKLGIQTDTFDLEGKVINESLPKNIDSKKINDIIEKNFLGKINQIPPKFSAIKVDGKKLLEYAKLNLDVPLKKRVIEIFKFDFKLLNENIIEFKLKVSSGTYIRSIANDIGIALGTYGHLIELRRTEINNINISEINLNKLISSKDLLKHITHIEMNKEQLKDISYGKSIELKNNDDIIIATKLNKAYALLEKGSNNSFLVKRGLF